MTRAIQWLFRLGVVVLSALALWAPPRAEAMPPMLAVLAVGVAAIASSEPAVAAPTPGQQAGTVLSQAMNGIQAAGVAMAGSLWSEGMGIFWSVWTLMLGWTIYKNYHMSEDLVGSLALFGATSMFIYIVLMLYMPPRGGVGTWGGSPVYMAPIFTSQFDAYAQTIAGSSGIAGGGVNWNSLQAAGAKLFWNSIVGLMNYAEGAHLLPDKPDWMDYIVAIGREFVRIPHIFLALVASLFVGLAMVVFIFVVLMADVLSVVGLTLGPIMIPFYLMPVLSFLFDGWLRFMITAGFYKLVATIMLALTYNLVVQLQTTSQALAAAGNGAVATWSGDFLSLCLAVVIAFMAFLMMWQVPSIAAALMQGRQSGSISGAAATMQNAVNEFKKAVSGLK